MSTNAWQTSVPCEMYIGTEPVSIGLKTDEYGQSYFGPESFDNSPEEREIIAAAATIALDGARKVMEADEAGAALESFLAAQQMVKPLSPYTRTEFDAHATGVLTKAAYLRRSRDEDQLVTASDIRPFTESARHAVSESRQDYRLSTPSVDGLINGAYAERWIYAMERPLIWYEPPACSGTSWPDSRVSRSGWTTHGAASPRPGNSPILATV